jgi:hypothetical protein
MATPSSADLYGTAAQIAARKQTGVLYDEGKYTSLDILKSDSIVGIAKELPCYALIAPAFCSWRFEE